MLTRRAFSQAGQTSNVKYPVSQAPFVYDRGETREPSKWLLIIFYLTLIIQGDVSKSDLVFSVQAEGNGSLHEVNPTLTQVSRC